MRAINHKLVRRFIKFIIKYEKNFWEGQKVWKMYGMYVLFRTIGEIYLHTLPTFFKFRESHLRSKYRSDLPLTTPPSQATTAGWSSSAACLEALSNH